MRELINLVESQQLNEATFDKELDKIVDIALKGSDSGGMIDRDRVLNKGLSKALELDDKEAKGILDKITNFAVTDDFLERQYFGKVAEKIGLKGMYMTNGSYVNAEKKDEFGRYQSSRGGPKGAAEAQNETGLLPGQVAKKFEIDLKFKGSANDPNDPDSNPDKELRLQSNGSRTNFNIDRTQPFVDEVKDGKKIRTYGTPEDLKKRFGDDAKIMGLPKEPAKADQDAAKGAEKGIVINDDNIMKYVDRYEELISKATKNSVQFASQFKSVFGSMANILKEEKLSDKEEQELQQIVDAMKAAIKNKTLNDANIGFAQDIVDNWKYDKEMAIASEKEKVAQAVRQASKDAEANKFSGLPKGYRAERDGDKVLIYKGDDLVARYNIQDGDSTEEIQKQVLKMAQMNAGSDTAVASDQDAAKGAESKATGALAKFAKSGKGGLANDADEVDAIKELQERLKDMGIGMTVDGKYSKGTVDAVKRVQEMLGEKQDGDAGPKTIDAILKMGNIPGVLTFYDDLKRLAELSKKVKKESNDFRYVLTILEGGNLLEALTAAEQKEYDELMKKHQAKFDDPEYQVALPKSVQDLMSQVIKQGSGAASNQGAGKGAEDDFKGLADTNKKPKIIGDWFVEMPKDIQKELGLGSKKDLFINLYTGNVGTIYISRSSEKHVSRTAYAPGDSDHKVVMDFLNANNIETKKGDPRKGPSGEKDATASKTDAGKDTKQKEVYDTQYTGDYKKDIPEFYKGLEAGLDPVDEVDDMLKAIDDKLKASGTAKEMEMATAQLREVINVLNSNSRIPGGKEGLVRNIEGIDQRQIERAIRDIKVYREDELQPMMFAALEKEKDGDEKDGEEKATASDQGAGKGAEATKGFDANSIAMNLKKAADAGITSGKLFGTDKELLSSSLDRIKTPEQLAQVDKVFQGLHGMSVEEMIKDELGDNLISRKDRKEMLKKLEAIKGTKPADQKADATTADSTTASKPVGDGRKAIAIGKGDWDRISKEAGFKDVDSFVAYQRKAGIMNDKGQKLQANDVFNFPMQYAQEKILWATNPVSSGVTSNSTITKTDKEVPSATAQTNAKTDTTQQTDKAASNQAAGQSADTKPSVEPRPVGSGRNVRGSQLRWDRQYKNTHNPDGTPKNENKEYDMTKKVNEAASMNISMSGDNAGEVSELVSILRNAGMQDAKPVTPDMMPPMAKTISMVDEPPMMDKPEGPSPCGMGEDEVEEAEWDNSPDEEYKDDDYMNNDIAGGLNRPKDKGALRAKDPAIHNEEVAKYKAQLAKDLEEAYGKFTYKKTANGYEFGGKTYKSEQEARKAEQQAKLKNMGNKG